MRNVLGAPFSHVYLKKTQQKAIYTPDIPLPQRGEASERAIHALKNRARNQATRNNHFSTTIAKAQKREADRRYIQTMQLKNIPLFYFNADVEAGAISFAPSR